MNLNKEQVLGIVRHSLTFFGGLIISKGLIDESTLSEITGTIITLIGAVWSIMEKNKIK